MAKASKLKDAEASKSLVMATGDFLYKNPRPG